jgi:hypothetical protein
MCILVGSMEHIQRRRYIYWGSLINSKDLHYYAKIYFTREVISSTGFSRRRSHRIGVRPDSGPCVFILLDLLLRLSLHPRYFCSDGKYNPSVDKKFIN